MKPYTYRTVEVEHLAHGQERAYADSVDEYRVTIATMKSDGELWIPSEEVLVNIALAATNTTHRQRKADVIPGNMESHFAGWVETKVTIADGWWSREKTDAIHGRSIVIVRSISPSTD